MPWGGKAEIPSGEVKSKNQDVTPVAQPLRPTPFGLREKVEKKIEEVTEEDIIEVKEPTEWVCAVVIVLKPKQDDIRICINMRRINDILLFLKGCQNSNFSYYC